MPLTTVVVYIVGGFVTTELSTEGIASKNVFNECVSSKSCSAPVTEIGLHLNICLHVIT